MMPSKYIHTFVIVLLLIATGRAQWYQAYEDINAGTINRISDQYGDFTNIYGAGNSGRVFKSLDRGQTWTFTDLAVPKNFNDITLSSTMIFVAGDSSLMYRSTDGGSSWEPLSTPTSSDITAIYYDSYSVQLWYGTNNNELYYSNDDGQSWQQLILNDGFKDVTGYNFVDISGDYNGLIIAATRNDTSFVQRVDPYGSITLMPAPGDTLPDFSVSRLHYDSYNLKYYISGNRISDQRGFIYTRAAFSISLELPVEIFQGDVGRINSVAYYQTPQALNAQNQKKPAAVPNEHIWFVTDKGELYDSADNGSWQMVYRDINNRNLTDILPNNSGDSTPGIGLATGAESVSLRNDFFNVSIYPSFNDIVQLPAGFLEWNYNVPPDLSIIQDSVRIFSNVSGNVPFSASYDMADSGRIRFNVTRNLAPEGVPGETWTVYAPQFIRALKPDFYKVQKSTADVIHLVPNQSHPFDYTNRPAQNRPYSPGSNVVTGWFNDDDIFDGALYRNDSLIVFQFSDSGTVNSMQAFYMNLGIIIDNQLPQQLQACDPDGDGRPDFIIYDRDNVYIIENISNGGTFDFTPGINLYHTRNIRQVGLINIESNPLPDLLISNDSLFIVKDFSLTSRGAPPYFILNNNINALFKVTDLFRNGQQDLVCLQYDGDLVYYENLSNGYISPSEVVIAPGQNYSMLETADLTLDGIPEIIVSDGTLVDIYSFDFTGNKFVQNTGFSFIPTVPDTIRSLRVGEWGHEQNTSADTRFLDLVLLTRGDKVKFFENMGNETFQEVVGAEQTLSFPADQSAVYDADRNGTPDILAVNRSDGRMHFVGIHFWQPVITYLGTESDGVRLNWTPLPASEGNLDFYRVYRDSVGSDFSHADSFDFGNLNDTTFLDTQTFPFNTYWYKVVAFYNGKTKKGVSDPKEITLIKLLTGGLSGSLTDSINGFVVYDSIFVAPGQQLVIGPGVKIAFGDSAAFNVHGGLQVLSTVDQITDFTTIRSDSTRFLWNGIRFFPATDTVRFEWFNIDGAVTGINASGRPLRLQYGSIHNCEQGILLDQDTLSMINIQMDSTYTGILLGNGSRTLIKNIDILNSRDDGLHLAAGARASVRNCIVWFNQTAGIRVAAGAQLKLSYSTVDSLVGNAESYAVSNLPPVFMAQDDDMYQPDPLSPTVDAGDPNDPFDMEPEPNGGRINQGTFGNTPFATQSFRPVISVEMDSLFFMAFLNQSDTLNLDVKNNGSEDLIVSNATMINHPEMYSLENIPASAISPGSVATLRVIFSPDSRGAYYDSLEITSNDPSFPRLYVPVRSNSPNRPPYFTDEPPLLALSGVPYSYTPAYNDDDADDVTLTADILPDWLNFSTASGSLNGTPALTDTGDHPVRLVLEDSFGDTTQFNYVLRVIRENQPPVWTGADTLEWYEDKDWVMDLSAVIEDDITPAGQIIFNVTGNSNPAHLTATITDSILTVRPSADYFTFGAPDTLILEATDSDGAVAPHRALVWVLPVDDPPQIIGLTDTTMYTNVLFRYRPEVREVDGDTLSYELQSTLDMAVSDSGVISYTPILADTGTYDVSFWVYDGHSVVTDTFVVTIKPNFINPVENLTVSGADQALTVQFTLPENEFYSGTVIRYSATDTLAGPEDGQVGLDSAFSVSPGTQVSAMLTGLSINQTYHIAVYNYFNQNGTIFSPPVRDNGQTNAPLLELADAARNIILPVNRVYSDSLRIYNNGDGTLLFRYHYKPDSLTDVWFSVDTMMQTIAPHDSGTVAFSLHPNKYMPRGIKTVVLEAAGNAPNLTGQTSRITMQPIFDDFAPHVELLFHSDSLNKESAFRAAFLADDTSDVPLGYIEDSLLYSYRLWRMADSFLVASVDGSREHTALIYPLEEGFYTFRVWAYDPEDNGRGGLHAQSMPFYVRATKRTVVRNRWFMFSIPKAEPFRFSGTVPDSVVQMYRWNNSKNRYDAQGAFINKEFPYGQGAWLISAVSFPVDLGTPLFPDSDAVLTTPVQQGWNLLGIPVTWSVNWRSMAFADSNGGQFTLVQAVQDSIIEDAVFWYTYDTDAGTQGYKWAPIDEAVAEPWQAYWVFARRPGNLIFSTEAAGLFPDTLFKKASTPNLASATETFMINISARGKGFNDSRNEFGVAPEVKSTMEPPSFNEQGRFYFTTNNGQPVTRSLKTMRHTEDLLEWRGVIETTGKQTVTLSWQPRADQQDLHAWLVDNKGQHIVDMNRETHYTVEVNGRYVLTFQVSADDSYQPVLLPERFTLYQNYPNPFNPVTTIRFALPADADGARVSVEVYDILGQKVTTLLDAPLKAGYHEVQWKGVSDRKIRVSSGVYFYKIQAGRYNATRKMVLIK
ncbi:MAG: T9SS C-terminal target domain-containing protein [Calditrichaeota bacterium]|nr:MAG: T9SS C-terminal target domain-containing protein [Calditrichota bacterium]